METSLKFSDGHADALGQVGHGDFGSRIIFKINGDGEEIEVGLERSSNTFEAFHETAHSGHFAVLIEEWNVIGNEPFRLSDLIGE